MSKESDFFFTVLREYADYSPIPPSALSRRAAYLALKHECVERGEPTVLLRYMGDFTAIIDYFNQGEHRGVCVATHGMSMGNPKFKVYTPQNCGEVMPGQPEVSLDEAVQQLDARAGAHI